MCPRALDLLLHTKRPRCAMVSARGRGAGERSPARPPRTAGASGNRNDGLLSAGSAAPADVGGDGAGWAKAAVAEGADADGTAAGVDAPVTLRASSAVGSSTPVLRTRGASAGELYTRNSRLAYCLR